MGQTFSNEQSEASPPKSVDEKPESAQKRAEVLRLYDFVISRPRALSQTVSWFYQRPRR